MTPSNDLLALAGTLYGEIRGGTLAQKQNVAQVILNRHNSGRRPTIRDVCLAPKQFSCWNGNDVNKAKILNADKLDPTNWTKCLAVAHDALVGKNVDRVDGALNYYSPSGMKDGVPPSWAKGATVTLKDGLHVFVKL